MIIDVHAHPLLFDVINENPEDLNFRKQEFGVFKSGINPVDFEMTLLADAQIDKVVLLPEDYSAESGRPIVSNDEMRARSILSGLPAWIPGRRGQRRSCLGLLMNWG